MISMSCWIARLCYRRIMPQVQFIYCIEGSKMTRSFCINKWVVVSPYIWTKLGKWQEIEKSKGKQFETKYSEPERQNYNERQQTNTRNDINKCKENNYKRVETVCLPSSPSCAGKNDSLLLYLQRTWLPLYMCYTLANKFAFGMTDSNILFYYLFQAIFETLNKFLYTSIQYCCVDLDIYLNIARFTCWVSDKLRCIEEETHLVWTKERNKNHIIRIESSVDRYLH